MSNTPTRFPKGSTNVTRDNPMNMLPCQDPSKAHVYFTDFDSLTIADFTVTKVGSGTTALAAGDGGVLLATNTAGATDSIVLTKTPSNFNMSAGLQTWFRTSFQTSDATKSKLMFGLVNATATTFSPTDGFWFSKAAAGTAFALNYASTTATAQSVTGQAPSQTFALANATEVVLSIYWDGVNTVWFYINDTVAGSIVVTSVTAVALAPVLAIQNGEAVAKTLSIDYLMTAKERTTLA